MSGLPETEETEEGLDFVLRIPARLSRMTPDEAAKASGSLREGALALMAALELQEAALTVRDTFRANPDLEFISFDMWVDGDGKTIMTADVEPPEMQGEADGCSEELLGGLAFSWDEVQERRSVGLLEKLFDGGVSRKDAENLPAKAERLGLGSKLAELDAALVEKSAVTGVTREGKTKPRKARV